MGRSLDSNIYGSDETSMASSIASDALDPSPGMNGANESDYWGSTTDERAVAKGNNPEYDLKAKVEIIRKAAAGGGDNEGLDDSTKGGQRHRPGPKTSYDDGVKYPGPAGKR